MAQIYPQLIAYFKDKREPGELDKEWIMQGTYTLKNPVVRIGRSRENEIIINLNNDKGSLISRRQCTLIQQVDNLDYEILDGTIEEITVSNIKIEFHPSKSGTYVNGRKLEEGEKILLKDNDRITLVSDRIEFVYRRTKDPVSERPGEATYVPELEEQNV